jgi:hypothetical protein
LFGPCLVRYTVELDVWDWVVGWNFVTAMSDALERRDRALLSMAYFDRSPVHHRGMVAHPCAEVGT